MFDYFRAGEEEQFAYFKIPRILMTEDTFKNISVESKFLYGLLLDRTSLSKKHGWYDENNRVYVIYTIQNAMEDLNFGKNKVCDIFGELESVGLIERVKRSKCLPSLTYVKKFFQKSSISHDVKMQEQECDFVSPEKQTSEDSVVCKKGTEVCKKGTEVCKSNTSYTNYSYTDLNYPKNINNNNIHRNTPPIIPPHGGNEEVPEMEIDKYDAMIPDDIHGCVRRELRDWLEYKHEKKQDYKDLGFTQMLTKIRKGIKEFGEECVAESISDAMSNNYAGFFIKKRATKNYGDSGYPSPDDITRMALELQEGYDSELGRNRNANL